MTNVTPSPEQLRKGRRFLKEVLFQTKAATLKRRRSQPAYVTVESSTHLHSVLSRTTERNLDALIVYEQAPGKWQADLHLKGMPRGFPGVFGTPATMPCPSEAVARKAALELLELALNACLDNQVAARDTKLDDRPTFSFDNGEMKVPQEVVDRMAEGFDGLPLEVRPVVPILMAQMRHRLLQFFGTEDLQTQAWESAEPEQKETIFALAAGLLSLGAFRYDHDVAVSAAEYAGDAPQAPM